eukprot:3638930-Prymnesium_polylepis.2
MIEEVHVGAAIKHEETALRLLRKVCFRQRRAQRIKRDAHFECQLGFDTGDIKLLQLGPIEDDGLGVVIDVAQVFCQCRAGPAATAARRRRSGRCAARG